MNRKILFGIGAVIVIVLVAIWVWLLFFASSSDSGQGQGDEEVFANLDFGDTTDPNLGQAPDDQPAQDELDFEDSTIGLVDTISDEPLKQLTTKRVAGFTEVQSTATSSKYVYFVEAGLGHVYSINLDTGEELRLSGTTVAGAAKAAISPSGAYVVIQSGDGAARTTIAGTLLVDEGQLSLSEIEDNIQEFSITDTGELLYSVQTDNRVFGKVYNFVSKSSRTLFTVPFREARIVWGDDVSSNHYVHPKAASELQGYGYVFNGTALTRLPIDGFGLVLEGNESNILMSTRAQRSYESSLYNLISGTQAPLALTVLPEKCVFGSMTTSLLVCARDGGATYGVNMPDQWYKGAVLYSDDLWILPIDGSDPFMLFGITENLGRGLDIVVPQFGSNDELLYFVHRIDETLWVFDRSHTVETETITEETI